MKGRKIPRSRYFSEMAGFLHFMRKFREQLLLDQREGLNFHLLLSSCSRTTLVIAPTIHPTIHAIFFPPILHYLLSLIN